MSLFSRLHRSCDTLGTRSGRREGSWPRGAPPGGVERYRIQGIGHLIVTRVCEVGVTFDEYQKAAARTMNPRLTDNERLLDAAAGIAEEAGEVLAHVRKHLFQGKKLDREKLVEELGDVLWCVAGVATAAGLQLGAVAWANTRKLSKRYPAGFGQGE